MKKITLTCILLITAYNAIAQTNLYKGKNEIKIDSISYSVENSETYYVIYKNINTKIHNPLESHGIKNWDDKLHKYREMAARERDNPFIIKAMKEVFTEEEISAMVNTREKIAMAFMYDETGWIQEMSFAFPDNPVFYSTPPEKWMAWEEKIKEYLRFPVPFDPEGDPVYHGMYFYLWEVE